MQRDAGAFPTPVGRAGCRSGGVGRLSWGFLNRSVEIRFNICKNSLTEPLAAKSPEHEF